MTENQSLARLEATVQEATLIREMCQTEGFKILKKKFEEKTEKAKNRLLDMTLTDEQVRDVRQKLFVWTEVMTMLKALMTTGAYASRTLNDFSVPADSGQDA